jgi:hydroxyacylglutathione hydrolase
VARPGPLAIYCDNGYRSAIAASLLKAQGFGEVADMAGGFEAWKALGLPVAR